MSQHLTRLRVEGFHGLSAVEVQLDTLTVLLGESRVGKTTLLDALERTLGVGHTAAKTSFSEDDFGEGPDGARLPIAIFLQFSGPPPDPVLEELAWVAAGQLQLTLRVTAAEPGLASWAFLGAEDVVVYDDAPAPLCDRLRVLHPVLFIDAQRYALDQPPQDGKRARNDVFRRLFSRRGGLTPAELEEGLTLLRAAVDPGAAAQPALPRATARLREIVDAPGRLRALPEEILETTRSAGSQSLALFLLVAFLLEIRSDEALHQDAVPILAIEQPELRLHPTVASSLWGILELLPGQKVLTTHSPVLLAGAPLSSLRRLTRRNGSVQTHRLHRKTLDLEELRRIAFHLRLQQSVSLFARCWLLVEGESEVWLLSELARLCGYVLPAEGVACLTFAQCGLEPVLRLADDLGIMWHVMVDGDEAGVRYAQMTRAQLLGRDEAEHLTLLPCANVEQFMWSCGFADVFRQAAGDLKTKKRRRRRGRRDRRGFRPRDVIKRAIRNVSKPGLALRIAVAAGRRDGPGVPAPLRAMLRRTVALARDAATSPDSEPADRQL